MRTVEVKVYKYDELSPAAQSRARDWFRAASASDPHNFWSDHVTTDLKTVAAMMGWTIEDAAFSGFSSQGDGAQFRGQWVARDVKAPADLEAFAPGDACERNRQLRAIMAEHVELQREVMPDCSASVFKSGGRYLHSMATRFDTPDLRNDQLDKLARAARALMDWYYKQLEASYEHEQSDEVVGETIIANEYEFRDDGTRFIG